MVHFNCRSLVLPREAVAFTDRDEEDGEAAEPLDSQFRSLASLFCTATCMLESADASAVVRTLVSKHLMQVTITLLACSCIFLH